MQSSDNTASVTTTRIKEDMAESEIELDGGVVVVVARLGSPFKGQIRNTEDTLVGGPCGKKRCADRYDSSESSDRNPEAGEHCSAAAMRSFIRRIRHKTLPPVPQTVADLGNVLSTYSPVENIYRGTVSAGGASAVIFASQQMLDFLKTSKWLHIDGTFSVVPSLPKASQLWIIFIREGEKGYAAVFVLCQKRTKVLYNAIWDRILELCPQLELNLRGVWTDFEQAAVSSLRKNFPRIRIHGCWFHFDRAVTRKWDSLGMKKADKEILHLTFALPLLPANQFAEGCQELTALADPLAVGDLQALNTFTHYLRTQWVPLADVVSVHGTSVRTNNVAESFNRHSLKKLGGRHPGIWVFLDKLNVTIADESLKMARWRTTGKTGARPLNKVWVRADENIAEAQRLLDNKTYTIEQFLRAAMDRHQRMDMQDAARRIRADGEDQHVLPDPADMLHPENVYPDDPADVGLDRPGGHRPRRNGRQVVVVDDRGSILGNDERDNELDQILPSDNDDDRPHEPLITDSDANDTLEENNVRSPEPEASQNDEHDLIDRQSNRSPSSDVSEDWPNVPFITYSDADDTLEESNRQSPEPQQSQNDENDSMDDQSELPLLHGMDEDTSNVSRIDHYEHLSEDSRLLSPAPAESENEIDCQVHENLDFTIEAPSELELRSPVIVQVEHDIDGRTPGTSKVTEIPIIEPQRFNISTNPAPVPILPILDISTIGKHVVQAPIDHEEPSANDAQYVVSSGYPIQLPVLPIDRIEPIFIGISDEICQKQRK